MKLNLRAAATGSALVIAISIGGAALAQKQGGVLKTYDPDSPGGLSIQEEATVFARGPMMGVFNNLIMYDQHVPQNSLSSIVPDLATNWEWNEEGTELTFQLRHGVTFHDGKPFTARDVRCTWDLRMDLAPEKLRVNPGKSAFYNLAEVTTNGDWEVTFHLKRPQPAFPMSLAGDSSGSIPATCRRARCASIRSALARSNSSSSSPTNTSKSHATRIIGKRTGLISTASNTRSSRIPVRRTWPLSRGSSTSPFRCLG
jgi:ABC-type transport system substrate-binding protein